MSSTMMTDDIDAPAYPSFADMTATFAKIALLSFGGPAGQIALMHKVLVEERRWILLGAPFIERLRSNTALSGALATITAAVVGVILNLAVWFALHVVFRQVDEVIAGPLRLTWPAWSSLDLIALVLAILAAVAMFWFEMGMVKTLALLGAVGLAIGLLT